jgi:TolB-like protein/DNA-binding winged helix-turn-helix (wHTH) protein
MSRPNKQCYEFGSFRLDPAEHSLLRDGLPVPLRPKVFDILLLLVERHGRLDEKEELMRAVWAEQYVEEGNLNKNVSLLRQALGESGQSFIETVPKCGYRFVADVRTVNGDGVFALMVETPARASLVEAGEADEEASIADGAALAVGAVAIKQERENEETDARRVGKSAPWLRSKKALALPRYVAAVAAFITLAAVAYLFYPTRGGGEEAIDSVAVLPFVNASGDPNTEYLSEGISDHIINSLSRLPNLKIKSLNSVLRYKGKAADLQTVGRELNVRAVLVGRMTQRGDDVTISAELVDVRDNRRLWGGQYNRKLSDILAVQGEIAREISEGLRLRLTGEEQQRLAKQHTEDTEAYLLYSLGNYSFRQNTKEGFEKSIERYEQAIKLDPNYAPAYAGLAGTYQFMISRGFLRSKEHEEKVEWAALKALQLDDTLAEAHASLGAHKFIDFDWVGERKKSKGR